MRTMVEKLIHVIVTGGEAAAVKQPRRIAPIAMHATVAPIGRRSSLEMF